MIAHSPMSTPSLCTPYPPPPPLPSSPSHPHPHGYPCADASSPPTLQAPSSPELLRALTSAVRLTAAAVDGNRTLAFACPEGHALLEASLKYAALLGIPEISALRPWRRASI